MRESSSSCPIARARISRSLRLSKDRMFADLDIVCAGLELDRVGRNVGGRGRVGWEVDMPREMIAAFFPRAGNAVVGCLHAREVRIIDELRAHDGVGKSGGIGRWS